VRLRFHNWIGREYRHEHALAATALAVLLNVMFFPYIWGNLNLMSSANDVPSVTALGGPNGDPNHPIDQTHWKMLDENGSGLIDEPTFALVHHELFGEHDIPLWNPDVAFGAPLAAEMQQQPFYPLTAIVIAAPGPSIFAAYIALRFFVAGFTTYLFLRCFVGFWPALGGGIAYMLNGYFIKYGTMPHLSVETLTGALFFGVELVLRRRKPWLTVPFLAVTVWIDFLGGMPESSFINIVFATIYGIFRVLAVPAYRAAWRVRARDFALALACGFACAAFLLLPFAEFVVNSFNTHEGSKNGGMLPALGADASPATSLALYAMPMLFGPPRGAIGIGFNDGYFGITLIYCALAAMTYAVRRRRSALAAPIAFFTASLALLTAKRYGVPAVNWIGYLPIVRVIALGKYQEAATAFAMAALVGFGLHALFVNVERRRVIALTASVITLALLQTIYDLDDRLASSGRPNAEQYFFVALAGGLLALIAFAAISTVAASRVRSGDQLYAGLAVAVLSTELAFNYFVPMYYLVDPGPPKKQNPYLGAAYLDYLHQMAGPSGRIYAEHTAVLEPDWSQAFDLKDIRDIDAIYVDRYLPFCRAFIPENHIDLREDYSGAGDYTMATPLGQKFLSLSSVYYIVTPDMLDPTSLSARIEKDAIARKETVGVGLLTLGSQSLDGFAQPNDSMPLTYAFDMNRDISYITLALGFPTTFGHRRVAGANFTMRLTDVRGTTHIMLARPYDSRSARPSWERHEIDVRRYAGTRVTLSFEVRTTGLPSGTPGYWGDIRQENTRGEADPFSLDKHFPETNIFTFAHPLPRGALYENVTLANDASAALATITAPEFNVFTSAVIARSDVPTSLESAVNSLTRQAPARVRAADLKTYTATDVSYQTDERKPALFFLSDTDYPGWKAFVDAKETPILRANYLFRGVVVGPGKHVVEFRYEPLSFRIGLFLCACGLLALGAFAFLSKRSGSTPPGSRMVANATA
jgi:hypothetical protein